MFYKEILRSLKHPSTLYLKMPCIFYLTVRNFSMNNFCTLTFLSCTCKIYLFSLTVKKFISINKSYFEERSFIILMTRTF